MSAPHCFVRLAGFGQLLLPEAPFRISRGAAGELWFEGEGDHDPFTPDGAPLPQELGSTQPGGRPGDWVIQTSLFQVPWPRRLSLQSAPDPGSPPFFDLVGPDDSLIFVQGPLPASQVDDPARLVGPGQELAGQGREGRCSWARLAYAHEGVPWSQRHHVVPLGDARMVVSSQAPAAHAPPLEVEALEVAMGLEATGT